MCKKYSDTTFSKIFCDNEATAEEIGIEVNHFCHLDSVIAIPAPQNGESNDRVNV